MESNCVRGLLRKIKGMKARFTVMGIFGIVVILLMLILSAISFLFMKDYHMIPTGGSLESPSLSHWLGTDDLGIDIFCQICHGAFISLMVGFSSAFIAGIGGSLLGIMAGYYGGLTDRLITGMCDVMMSIPQLPLMIVLGSFFGSGMKNIIFVIGLISWTGPARIARSKVISMRNERYISAAKSFGAGFLHMAFKHFIPGIMPVISVGMIRIISHAIVAEAGLSFLGLGDPVSKSWGIILNRSINFPGIYFTDFWKWWIMSPLTALILSVVSFALISRDIEKYINTKL